VRLTGVQRNAHPEGSWRVIPGFGLQGSLCLHRRGQGMAGNRKGRLHRITNDFEEDALTGLDRHAQEVQVPVDGLRHCLAVSLPQRGAPLDIRKEEGDGATRKIDHQPTPDGSSKVRLL
jgi:hypothetical protein